MLPLELRRFLEEALGRHGEELGGIGGPVRVEHALAVLLARLAELGGKPIRGTPQDFGKVIAAETAKWAKVVIFSGAKVE